MYSLARKGHCGRNLCISYLELKYANYPTYSDLQHRLFFFFITHVHRGWTASTHVFFIPRLRLTPARVWDVADHG